MQSGRDRSGTLTRLQRRAPSRVQVGLLVGYGIVKMSAQLGSEDEAQSLVGVR